MGSALLYHGPEAENTARLESEAKGRLLLEVSSDSMKVDEIREAVVVLGTTPVGRDVGVVLLGPMDEASCQICDTLLKSIEECETGLVLPVLWARDLSGVPGTLRSRCETVWCPGEATGEVSGVCLELWEAIKQKDIAKIVAIVKTEKDSYSLMEEFCRVVVSLPDGAEAVRVWKRIRRSLRYRNLTQAETLTALLQTLAVVHA